MTWRDGLLIVCVMAAFVGGAMLLIDVLVWLAMVQR